MIGEIKARVAVTDVLADTGIQLHRGRGACPLCGSQNRTAFSIKGGRFKCFVCNAGGDVITLIERLHGLDTKAAIKHLALKAGIRQGRLTPSEREAMQRAKAERGKKRALVAALDKWAQDQRDVIAPLLQGTRRLLAKGLSYHAACQLGAEFFDNMALLEYTHDDILSKGDRGAHLRLFKMELGL